MNSQKTSSAAGLVVMSAMGWILACIFGVLSCFLAADAHGRDVPFKILAAIFVGPILAAFPIGVILFAAHHVFSQTSGTTENALPQSALAPAVQKLVGWRWVALIILGGFELLLLPLTIAFAGVDDDTLALTIPLNTIVLFAILVFACVPHRRNACIALCSLHIVGMALATFAAAVDVESVVVSGFLLTVTGIAVASLGERPHIQRVTFGLSTVAFAFLAFFVIAIGEVSQRDADAPLFAAIVVYQVLFVPLGLIVVYRALTKRQSEIWTQFGLKQLLAVMGAVCVAAAAARISFTLEDDFQIAFAVGFAALILLGLGATVFLGLRKTASNNSAAIEKPQPA